MDFIGPYICGGFVLLLVLFLLRDIIYKPKKDDYEAIRYMACDTSAELEWENPIRKSEGSWIGYPLLVQTYILLLGVALLMARVSEYNVLFLLYAVICIVIVIAHSIAVLKRFFAEGGIYSFNNAGLSLISEKRGRSRLLFTWKNIVWFKPTNNGFEYYFKRKKPLRLASGVRTYIFGGKVLCGEYTDAAHSVLRSHRVPESPPK